MTRFKVYLTGGENKNWALDSDLRQTRTALEPFVDFTPLADCDVVHSMWWAGLEHIPERDLIGKRVISHVPGEPFRYFQSVTYQRLAGRVSLWIAQSTQAKRQLENLKIKSELIPYTIDTSIFRPLPQNEPAIAHMRAEWNIPQDKYLIGNFHRDSEGDDLTRPKLVKGPDIFLEMIKPLVRAGRPVHVVLAGPRRHWLRQQLAREKIPYTFVGEASEKDDMALNILPAKTLNLLYNLIDLYVISSRSEGGPRSIMEAAAARCKIISTPVGLAGDILEPRAIFHDPAEAVEILRHEIDTGFLSETVSSQFERVQANHQPEAVASLFEALYQSILEISPYAAAVQERSTVEPVQAMVNRLKKSVPAAAPGRDWLRKTYHRWVRPPLKKARQRWKSVQFKLKNDRSGLTVCLWHEFKPPPYGGGNQFMILMRKGLLARGITVVENQLDPDIDVYLLNSIHFDIEAFLNFKSTHDLRVVHRIDGPIHLIRGYDREKDELCYQFNDSFASASIIQSNWTLQRIIEFGYQPINPVIVNNAADPDIFHPHGRVPFDRQRKTRLISSSWSDNPRKGGPVYKWIEENLDWNRYEYTFVGRASEEFERIKQLAPVPSDELAGILRQHDIYITASQRDPCSNAVIEALSCGLPALYFNDGGHPELVQQGGLPFESNADVLPQLEKLTANYEMFQNLITPGSMEQVVDKYLFLLKEVGKR